MDSVSSIGKCVGCRSTGRLYDGACNECLSSPKRGARWIELAKRIKDDPEFALICFNKCQEVRQKIAFIEKYGLPDGADDPRPVARVIQFRR